MQLARWEVLVADPKGRPVASAAITAAPMLAPESTPALTATGRAEWHGVQPGTYALAVEATGFPRWTAEIVLVRGANERTLVRLGEECRVVGRVRDTRGTALRDHMVAFLKAEQRPPESAPELFGLPHTTTAGDGTFELVLPGAGEWRLVVVHGGRLVHEETRTKALAGDRTERAEVVVQASTRLTLRLDAELLAPGAEALTNYALTIYALASPIELARREELRRHMAELAARGSDELEPDDPEALEERRRAQAGESDPALLAQLERQKHWATVVPEGWVKVQSTAIPERRVVVFDRLPHDTELRLALRQGDEVLRVAPALFLGLGADQAARLVPPARLAAGA